MQDNRQVESEVKSEVESDVLRGADLFAGIGGMRLGLEQAFGDKYRTVFVSEIDRWAKQTYRANFHDEFEIAGDICQIKAEDIPDFDICMAGFPCQPFSIEGKRKGFNDCFKGVNRGVLFFEIARICRAKQPKVILLENVRGLVIHDEGRTLQVILDTLQEIGYKTFWTLLNSADFGVPQHRIRLFIVAFRKDIAPEHFYFPEPTDQTKRIRDIIEASPVPARYYLSTNYLKCLYDKMARSKREGRHYGYSIRSMDGLSTAVIVGGGGRECNLIVDKRQKDLRPTTHITGVVNTEGIRMLTPREMARLQGFPDTFILPCSNYRLYRQFGNAVTVPVVKAVALRIKAALQENLNPKP